MDKQLSEDISKLPPGDSVNVRSFILAIIALSGVVYFLYTVIINDRKSNEDNLKAQIVEIKADCRENKREDSISSAKKDLRIDSLTLQLYNLSMHMYNKKLETVNELRISNKTQRKILK